MLLTATERLTMNTRPKNPANARNLNFCGIGSSGSGKTRFWLTPQLLQAHSSYVVVDPKGGVLGQVGSFLQKRGYKIKVFNSIDFSKSMHYNPLAYIKTEADILKFVNALISNTKGEGKEGDPFWTKAETLLYCALLGYIIFEGAEEDRNMNTLVDMISGMEVKEDDEDFLNAVDYMFKGLEQRKPNCFAVKQYKKYKLSSGVVCSKRLLNQAVGKSLRTHNLKPKKGAQVMRKNEKITALYERLSRDDFGKDDDQQRESNSISNQKAMLEEFAARQGFTNIVHFTDDGISGTCFDRPGFLAMMKEVEAGNVEYLCIKDMSRMGRDYLKVGQIMEILRQRGVRLIAINDGVDSARGDDDFTPFRNIMNEYYARDTSRKIRSTFQSKGKSGKHLTGTVIYGYLWNEAREDDETFKNPVDVMFDELEARDPDHFAVKQYRKYKLAAGKTAKSILISCGARLAPFDIAELRELMSYDEMELDTIGDRKTALFVIISDTDDTFNFVVAIMYSQLFNLLCDKADDIYNGRLPVHVRCLLDEFANIGQIPKFDKLIATIRSREISASIILQSQSQLKTIYKDAADTITGNCDCTLFLGGKEKSTLKEISEVLGKETIDLYNTSETRSNNNSYGLNYQKTGKELMSQDEIAVMDGAKCILQLRGVRPFLSNKYDITKHPKYRQLSDYDKRNAFDIEKYRQHKLVVKPDDTFDLYDMGEVEAD